jgi:hypothetical protein
MTQAVGPPLPSDTAPAPAMAAVYFIMTGRDWWHPAECWEKEWRSRAVRTESKIPGKVKTLYLPLKSSLA